MAPRKKKPDGTAKILRYSDSAMQDAMAAVREGRFKIREASRHFGVPYSTLNNKVNGKVPAIRKMGRDTYFTTKEENILTNYIIAMAKKGIPIKRQTLIETVKKILDDDKRITPFKSNRPGRKWIGLFLKRHPEITERNAEGISTARAAVTANNIKEWHKSLQEHLKEENALDILEDPQRIFNADESGFQTCPASGKVLGPVGMKNFYEIKSGKEKEQLTVMATINAAGQVISPMIVYPLVRISKEISTNVPEDWAIGKSPKGWMTGPLYYEYIANIFDPWLKTNSIKKPVLLLIDGHRSHMTLQASQYCSENQIIVYALFPNSTHITQPADVSLFKCLKSGWKNTVSDYKQNTGNRQITRAGFAPLLAKVFKEKVTTEVVQNGFKRCGIYPFDISSIDLSRCMDHETRKAAPIPAPTCEIGVENLLLLESFMRRGRVEEFRKTDEQWEGDESAKELFYVWKKFRINFLTNSDVNLSAKTDKSPMKDLTNSLTKSVTPERTPSPSILLTPPAPNFEIADMPPTHYIELKLQQIETTPPAKCPEPKTIQSHQIVSPVIETNNIQRIGSSSKLVEIVAQKQKLVSPAFGKHIIWPSDSPLKKRKTERLPFATTSKKWQDYWSTKEREKEEKNEKAEQRKRIREEKQMKKGKLESRKRVKSVGEQNDDYLSGNETETEENNENYGESKQILKEKLIKKNITVRKKRYNIISDSEEDEDEENKKAEQRKRIREDKQMKKGKLESRKRVKSVGEQNDDYLSGNETETEENNEKYGESKQILKEKLIKKNKTVRKKRYNIISDSEEDEDEENKKAEQRKRIREDKQMKKGKLESRKRVISVGEQNDDYWSGNVTENEVNNENHEESKQILKEKLIKKKKTVRKKRGESEQDEDDWSTNETENEQNNEKDKKNIIIKNESDFNTGDFVIFVYESSCYVGMIIDHVSQEGALIKSMHKSLNNWKWPEKEDVNLYSLQEIKEKIKEPRLINFKRGIYSVPEFEKYLDFIQ